MDQLQLEAFVLDIVKRVTDRRRVEDDRVELKADWPDATRTAVRLAGHANAGGGSWILWIVGLDERRGVVGASDPDLSSWWPQVQAQYESRFAPRLLQHLVVPTSGRQVVALQFEASRRPYVVKNPHYGTEGGCAVEFFVPWRAATATQSARREDLISALYPAIALPDVEVLAKRVFFRKQPGQDGRFEVQAKLFLYVTPSSETPVVIPTHRCSAMISLGEEKIAHTDFSFHHPAIHAGASLSTPDDIRIMAPGKVEILMTFERDKPPTFDSAVELEVRLVPVKARAPLVMSVAFEAKTRDDHEILEWG